MKTSQIETAFGMKGMRAVVEADADARDAQQDIIYFDISRPQNEPAGGVDDYRLHPVGPRQVRVSVRLFP